MRQMHSSFPLVACASEECENWRYVLQYKDERGVGGGSCESCLCHHSADGRLRQTRDIAAALLRFFTSCQIS